MSLSEQTSRVANGGKQTLKTILEKMGATVPSTTLIDGYPAIAAGLVSLAVSSNTKALFDLPDTAGMDDMLNVLAHTGDLHVWKRTQNGEVDYPVSPNPDAYQDGTSGNTTIEYIGQLGKKVQLATGSYVGTGTYGVSNPNTLTFASAPKIWSIYAYDHNAGTGLWNTFTLSMIIPAGITSFTLPYQGSNATELTLSYNGNAVSWYTETGNSAAMQFNTSGDIYYYWALI